MPNIEEVKMASLPSRLILLGAAYFATTSVIGAYYGGRNASSTNDIDTNVAVGALYGWILIPLYLIGYPFRVIGRLAYNKKRNVEPNQDD